MTLKELLDTQKPLLRAHRAVRHALIAPFEGKSSNPLAELPQKYMERLYGNQPPEMKCYPVFNDFFGLEVPIARACYFFHRAGDGGVEEKLILSIFGPQGSGKSTVLRNLIERMEDFSFFALDGCPYREHPLHAIPRREREQYFRSHGYFIGELCGHCVKYLRETLKGDWRNFPISEHPFNLHEGIGVVLIETSLSQPNAVGETPRQWYEKIYGANGGLLIVDLTRQPEGFRKLLGEIVQSGILEVPGSAEMVSLDLAVVSVGNEDLRIQFKTDKPFLDRCRHVEFHLPLSPTAEEKVFQKAYRYTNLGETHFLPHGWRALAILNCASRIRTSSLAAGLKEKLFFYEGRMTLTKSEGAFRSRSYRVLKGDQPKDGMMGVSTRLGGKILDLAQQRGSCVTVLYLLEAAKELFQEGGLLEEDEVKDRIKQFLGEIQPNEKGERAIGEAEEEYQLLLVEDLTRAWMGNAAFEKRVESDFDQYCRHVEALLTNTKVKVRGAREGIPPDEKSVLKPIEEQTAMIGKAAEEFRQAVVAFCQQCIKSGVGVVVSEIEPLLEMIKKRIISEEKDELRSALLEKPIEGKPFDPHKIRLKKEAMAKELEALGYQNCCGDRTCCWDWIQSYAKNTLYR